MSGSGTRDRRLVSLSSAPMTTITVKLGKRSYPIRIEAGLIDSVGDSLRSAIGEGSQQAVIVTNPTVDSHYGARVTRSLNRAGFRTSRFLIPDGEKHKTLRTAESLYTFLIERRAERSDILVALGGGVVGDTAGFVAATFLRGLRFVQVPTTLLAQIDSSVGGKTGVNHQLGKNLIGVFHQPSLVVIDPETLQTLATREFRSGLYEAIKYGVIRDRRLFARVAARADRLKDLDAAELTYLIARSCRIKAEIVARDERERGLRRILNFGHTVGHALEAVTHYRRFLHGEAVAYGMRAASRMAEHLGLLFEEERASIDEAIARVALLPRAINLAVGDIMSAMTHDKKAEGGRVAFVLPESIGRVVVRSDVPLPVVRKAIRDCLSRRD